ncbi:MAG TPA: 23S rRNA (pseudouridine(1915)-N(3))-methyltransferase RlmH [Terriglobia bacterium]|nr:23S rRNA (pseudouridine(1915)-N(3))-methyltransferase RlmH [Terriglobia bacterium]
MRIRVIREGKPKDARLRALQADYEERIRHFIEIRLEEQSAVGRGGVGRSQKLSATERKWLEGLRGSVKVLLDPLGRELTSEEFAEWLGERAVRGTRDVVFLVGGDRGFAAAVRDEANLLLGLSRMTFTHDWACTVLLEQIYRAFTILRGYPYAK